MRRLILSIAAIVTLLAEVPAQTQERLFSIAFRGTYTTTSKVFYNPDSPSSDLRGQYNGLDNIYGLGFEVRYAIPLYSVGLSLSSEYLLRHDEQTEPVGFTTPPRSLPVKEGFQLIPIELGANIFIPLGTERLRLAMGGGLGAYIGRRYLTVAGVEAVQQSSPVTVGIHVETSFDYQVLAGVFVRGDMRFRDPEFTTESRFTQEAANYNGVLIVFPREPFRARVNVNGLNFGVGLSVDVL